MKRLIFKWRWILVISMLLVIIAVALWVIWAHNSVVPNRTERARTTSTVQFINENSKLPALLLTGSYEGAYAALKAQFDTADIERIPNYMSNDLRLTDDSVFISFTGYPEDMDEYCLIEESIKEIDRGYHVLGITIGSSFEDGLAILAENGFQEGDSYRTYFNGEVNILLEEDDAGLVSCVGVRINTYYTSGVIY